MNRKLFRRALIGVGLILCVTLTHAQVTSNFDTDSEGWTAQNGAPYIATTTYQSSGGNPGGYFSAAPPTSGGSINTSLGWYWWAPAKFIGEHDLSYGQQLKFDLQQSVAGADNSVGDVVITGSAGSIYYRLPQKPGTSWTSYSLPLDASIDWRSNGIAGPAATNFLIKAILSNVTGIYIRCKYINSAGYTCDIDNVILEERTLENAPLISSFTPLSALPGAEITITGNHFNATPENNFVYFGGVKGEVTTASITQLVVTVPPAAGYGQITVVNTATALSTKSSLEFKPLFDNGNDFGGHFIPGSFAENIVQGYGDFNDNGLAGINMADMDNDGLLDILGLEDGQLKVAIFRNLGVQGNVTTASFSSKIEFPNGELGQGNSAGLLVADFDNDGKLDFSTFSRGVDAGAPGSGGIAVTRNTSTPGALSFEPAERFYSVGIYISSLNAADIDGDGRLDLLVDNGGLYMARNISTPGNIEFATFRYYNALAGAVSYGDLNGDGKQDLIITNANDYSIIENLSTPGNFSLGTPVTFSGSIISGVTAADLDSDQKQDLILYRINGFNDYDLVIKKNIHAGGTLSTSSFGADVILSKVGRAYSQRAVDMNGDTKPEIIITANSGSAGNGFLIFENVGTPGTLDADTFLPEVYYEETSVGTLTGTLIGDINGDNKPDVVAFGSSDGGEQTKVLYQNLCAPAPNIAVHTVSPLKGPVGTVVTITGDNFSTIPSKNTVTFGAVKANVLASSKTEITAEVPVGATYDRVGVTRDYLTSRYHLPFDVTFSPGITFDANSFLPPVNFTMTGADYDVEVSDLNNDGKPDITAEAVVVTGVTTFYGMTLENSYTTGAISNTSFAVVDSTNSSAQNLRIVDIDEDGRNDIASIQGIYKNTTTSPISFQNLTGSYGGYFFSWADFDLDGKTDLVTPTGGATIQVYRNHSMPRAFRTGGYGTFAAAITFGKPGTGGGAVAADFDNDGNHEFAATSSTTDNIRIWRNAGGFPLTAAQFSVVGDIAAGDNPGRVYAGDLDLDGKIDLAIYHGAGTSAGQITVFHNTSTVGAISFIRQDYAIGSNGTVLALGDLDGDGKPEIVATGEAANRVSIFKNTSTPGTLDASSFAAPFHITLSAPRGIAIGDLNGDSKPELIVTRGGNLLSILENAVPTGPTITISTQPAFTYACEGSTATFNVEASGTTNITFRWQFDSGSGFADIADGNGYSGATTKSLSINTNTTGFAANGPYRCRVSGDLAPDVLTNSAQLTINSLPSPPDVTGDSDCISPATLTLTATGASDGDYNWYDVPTGGSVLGTNGSFVTPSIPATKTYYVTIEDTFCESIRVAVDAAISLLTKPTINSSEPVVSGGVNICDGEDCTLTAPTGFVTYTWSNGDTGEQITVDQQGSYSVIVEDALGCVSPSSDPVTVAVNPFPEAIISVNGTQLTVSPGDSYQWYQNGDAVSGATSQTFEFNVLEFGAYVVDVNDNGCVTTSEEFTYLITGTEAAGSGWEISPNPFSSNINITAPIKEGARAELIDVSGRSLKKFTLNNKNVLPTDDLKSGAYFLIIKTKKEILHFRIIKTH